MESTTSITIRHVPTTTRDELAARARRSGRSLQEFLLRELVDLADRPPVDEWLDRVQQRVEATGSTFTADEILAWRDAGRR